MTHVVAIDAQGVADARAKLVRLLDEGGEGTRLFEAQPIAEVLERKRQLFNELIEQNGPPPSLGLSEEEIFSLFDVQARPRRVA